ncbi:MAG: hypothetical protein WCL27_05355 [Betaproteobacteria bacterium]
MTKDTKQFIAFKQPATVWCVFLSLLLPVLSFATDSELPNLSVRGFGTLGTVHSSSNQFDYVRDISQPDGARGNWSSSVDSMLGIQTNYQINSSLEAVVQAISRQRYNGSYTPELSLAFLKYDVTPYLGLRLGRMGNEFYMLSDSRRIGYSSLLVRPPVEFYGFLAFYSFDGADLAITLPTSNGVLKAKVFAGVTGGKLPTSAAGNPETRIWDMSRSPMLGGYLDYTQGSWQLRATVSQLKFAQSFPAAEIDSGLRQSGVTQAALAADALNVKNRRVQYYSMGAIYENGSFQSQLMFSRTVHESVAFENTDAAYGLLAYRLSAWTPYAGYSTARSKPKNVSTGLADYYGYPGGGDLRILDAAVRSALDGSHISQSTTFAGVRWDFRSNAALKLQWDSVRGSRGSNQVIQRESVSSEAKTNVFSLILDLVF